MTLSYFFLIQGCPVDTQDNSKRWCSTKVDRNGNHMVGQNQYGNCNQCCPRHIEKSQPLIQSIYLYLNPNFYIVVKANICKCSLILVHFSIAILLVYHPGLTRYRCTIECVQSSIYFNWNNGRLRGCLA